MTKAAAAAKASKNTKSSKTGGGSKDQILLEKGVPANFDAMKRAAPAFGVKVPAGKSFAAMTELYGSLRIAIGEKLEETPEEDRIGCDNCGEVATDATEFCPYCGDMGPEADDEGAVVAEVVDEPTTGIASRPSKTPARNTDAALADLETELGQRLDRIKELKRSTIDTTYDMGLELREISSKQLFKARGYSTFKDFADKELPVTRETAYRLIAVTERFSKEVYLEVGYEKLRVLTAVTDETQREELVEKARQGASSRALQRQVRESKGGAGNRKAPNAAAASTPPPPANKATVTLLTKVDNKPHAVGFVSAKTGKPIKSVGVLKVNNSADAYAEHRISDDVVAQIGLKVDKAGAIVGMTVRYVRSEK